MARISWLNDDNVPALDDQVQKLDHFTASLADGTIDKDELSKQQGILAAAMKSVESELTDEQHKKVTSLLVELTAYNVMQVLHELAAERVKKLFG
ncbi:MAG: hypothetical protein A2289_01860 [Deltaproteobacteria bacterium RIFOXYA12_FULL_58_15]|nr:MAG: hypothetical protein A2289_01860 [Deltaproteobacteria bacterium RIFOXYA12_FULL_58_15]OGR08761.1 MAG: hypothetical protein A2341_13765 [Deltaproteobacteria bacterium RIFOXYB12_FULL_58_9]